VYFDLVSYQIVFVLSYEDIEFEIEEMEFTYGEIPTSQLEGINQEDEMYIYTFVSWDKEIANVSQDATYTSIYKREYKLYQVTFKSNKEETTTTYNYLDTIVLPSNPTSYYDETYCYEFSNWQDYLDNMQVTSNLTFEAIYTRSKYYSLKIDDEVIKVKDGDEYTFNVTNKDGYDYKIIVDGNEVYSDNFTLTNIDNNHDIEVIYQIKTFKILVEIEGNGRYECDDSLDLINYGDSRNILLLANDNNKIENIYLDGKEVSINDNLLIENIKSNINLKVIFKEESNNNIKPIIISLVSGVSALILLLGILFIKNRKKKLVTSYQF
jgi:hypothetical protein